MYSPPARKTVFVALQLLSVAPNDGAKLSSPRVRVCIHIHDVLVEAVHLRACVSQCCAVNFFHTVPDISS